MQALMNPQGLEVQAGREKVPPEKGLASGLASGPFQERPPAGPIPVVGVARQPHPVGNQIATTKRSLWH
eukprot:TCALIF_03790-PA protein Name:"Protein of unknown function" AED:0.01 eAED:0.01 QI:0/0.5/0.66/0.66/0.5/0.33/3/187/68